MCHTHPHCIQSERYGDVHTLPKYQETYFLLWYPSMLCLFSFATHCVLSNPQTTSWVTVNLHPLYLIHDLKARCIHHIHLLSAHLSACLPVLSAFLQPAITCVLLVHVFLGEQIFFYFFDILDSKSIFERLISFQSITHFGY